MHEAIARLGVPADATVLEPGCGTGNFMSQAPAGHAVHRRRAGFASPAASPRLLHPDHDIRIENFRDTRLPEDRIDAVIGNVPFADVKLDYRGQKLSLHDFFFAKSLDALKPGGVLALVTTHFTLDKQNAAIREYLAAKADFVGAIRLPSDAFKREGTAVVTDILFLRKRAPGEPAQPRRPRLAGHRAACHRRRRGPDQPLLPEPSRDGAGHLEPQGHALRRRRATASPATATWPSSSTTPSSGLPEFAPMPAARRRAEPAPAFTPPPPERHIAEGSFFVGDDRIICQVEDGQAVPVVYGGTTLKADGTLTGKRLAALIGLRDLARRVLQSQNEGWPEANRNDARRELNRAYDRFVAAYGPINKTTFGETADGSVIRRMPNLVKFREDPDAMLVMSLEEYDEVTGKAAKAADHAARTWWARRPPVTHGRTAPRKGCWSRSTSAARSICRSSRTLYGKPEAAVIAELGDLIFHDPESRTWQTADAYLSGNVRAKLAAAEAAGPAYARNAEALRAVQPEDVLPGDIDANLGAPWIPDSDIQAFAAELFRVEPVVDPGRPPEERRGLERRGRLRRRGVGGRHRRIRHGHGPTAPGCWSWPST